MKTNLEKIESIQGYYANESSEDFPPVDLYSWYINTGDEGLTRSNDGATVRRFKTKRAAMNYLLCHKARKCADTLYHPIDSITGETTRKTIGRGEELWRHGYAPLDEKSLALIIKKYA